MDINTAADELNGLRQYLADLERRIADTQRVAALGSWEWELAADRLFWSEEVYRIFGVDTTVRPTAELFINLMHPDDRPLLQAAIDNAIVDLTPYALDLRILRPNGEGRVIHARGEAVLAADGIISRLIGIVQDITPSYEAAFALRQSEERYRVLLSALPDPLVIYDAEGRTTYINKAFEQTFGWGEADLLGKPIDFVPEDEREATKRALDQALRADDIVRFDSRRLTRLGKILDVQISGSTLRNHDGSTSGLMLILRDITERVRMEAELLAAQSSLISELSTPLMPISDEVMVMPLVGSIDSARAQQITERLLEGVAASKVRTAIIDITGVPVVDTQVADAILRAAQAVKLLGAQVVITGIGPEVAQTLVGIGLSLDGMITRGTLQSGIAYAMRRK
jgi:PAS domain S-box-containing protein